MKCGNEFKNVQCFHVSDKASTTSFRSGARDLVPTDFNAAYVKNEFYQRNILS